MTLTIKNTQLKGVHQYRSRPTLQVREATAEQRNKSFNVVNAVHTYKAGYSPLMDDPIEISEVCC